MEFSNADRTNDASFISSLNGFNKNVELYNKQRTKNILSDQEATEGLQSDAGSEANSGALKEAGQHATALAQGVKAALQVQKLGAPILATKDITTGVNAVKVGDIVGKETAQTIGKSAGKLASGLSVIGDIGSIGLDIAQDKANWGKMSTMDKVANVADIGGAGLDMLGTGLMTFGGPIGALFGLGIKSVGDIAEIASGTESVISGYQASAKKQTDLGVQGQKAIADEGSAQQKAGPVASEAGAGSLAVGRQAQV